MMTQGKRVYPKDGELWLKPGEYGVNPADGMWLAETPNGLLGGLENHEVTEHEDGTITVAPSILVNGYSYEVKADITWHGYLEHGIWREV